MSRPNVHVFTPEPSTGTMGWIHRLKIIRTQSKLCCLSTSMKGCGRIVKAEHCGVRFIWLTCTLGLLCVSFYLAFKILYSYFSFSTVVHMKTLSWSELEEEYNYHLNEIDLPSVTLCSVKRLRVPSEWEPSYAEYQEMIRELKFNGSDGSDNETASNMQHYDGLEGYYRATPFEGLSQLGQKKINFLVACEVEVKHRTGTVTEQCENYVDVIEFSSMETFNCLTFTITATTKTKDANSVTLKLILHLGGRGEDLVNITTESHDNSKGARVMAHVPPHYPDTDSGLMVTPGFETIAKVTQSLRLRLPAPHSQCQNASGVQYRDLMERIYTYTPQSCYKVCINEVVMKQCECYDYGLGMHGSDTMKPNKICGNINLGLEEADWTLNCVSRVVKEQNKICRTQCPNECMEREVATDMHHLRWPDNNVHLSLYENYLKNNRELASEYSEYGEILDGLNNGTLNRSEARDKLDLLTMIPKSLAKISIKFSQPSIAVTEDKEAQSLAEMVSQLGGALNLWSGITIFVLIELLEALVQMIIECVHSSKERNVE